MPATPPEPSAPLPPRRILVLGAGGRHKTEDAIARGARRLGHAARVVDVAGLARRLGALGLAVADRRARAFEPDFVLCTRHAHLLGAERLRALFNGRDAAVWYFDAAPRAEVTALARLAGTLYVTYLAQVPAYQREVPVVRFLPQALDPGQDHPATRVPAAYRCDASFVGSGPFPHRWPLLRAIAAACRLQIRGPGWRGAPRDLPVAGGEVRGRGFAKVVAGAAVNLGANAVPAQDLDRASASNRMWKILGCGGFYLGQRVPHIEVFARDGEHCRWYESVEEAVAITRWALAEPGRREEIAAAGRRHALAQHTYADRVRLLVEGRGYEMRGRGTGNGDCVTGMDTADDCPVRSRDSVHDSRMRSHRTLAAWQEGDAVAKGVLRLAKVHWQPYAAALINQLQRASLSVPLNIAEGYAAGGRRTFIRHLRIAYGSAIESGEILRMLLDLDDFPDPDVEPLLERCRRSQRLLLGLILKLDRDPNRSPFPVPRSLIPAPPIRPARSS